MEMKCETCAHAVVCKMAEDKKAGCVHYLSEADVKKVE